MSEGHTSERTKTSEGRSETQERMVRKNWQMHEKVWTNSKYIKY